MDSSKRRKSLDRANKALEKVKFQSSNADEDNRLTLLLQNAQYYLHTLTQTPINEEIDATQQEGYGLVASPSHVHQQQVIPSIPVTGQLHPLPPPAAPSITPHTSPIPPNDALQYPGFCSIEAFLDRMRTAHANDTIPHVVIKARNGTLHGVQYVWPQRPFPRFTQIVALRLAGKTKGRMDIRYTIRVNRISSKASASASIEATSSASTGASTSATASAGATASDCTSANTISGANASANSSASARVDASASPSATASALPLSMPPATNTGGRNSNEEVTVILRSRLEVLDFLLTQGQVEGTREAEKKAGAFDFRTVYCVCQTPHSDLRKYVR
ncbi:hypothetical protein EON64_06370 [archaeon]|nr:MAG: hypothetical protein EON64_06370 [archaeon]